MSDVKIRIRQLKKCKYKAVETWPQHLDRIKYKKREKKEEYIKYHKENSQTMKVLRF